MSKVPVRRFMTAAPTTIRDNAPVAEALKMLREQQVRHLPVLHGGKIVGVVSERDLHYAQSLHPTTKDLVVADVMSDAVSTAKPDTPLEEALEAMERHKLGSIVVEDDLGKPVGILTTHDVVRALRAFLRGEC
jgi:acetoin utilization protein AcuB